MTNNKLDAAIKEAAMGHLLGEYDAADIANEIAEEFPNAWMQLPREAMLNGLNWAQDHAEDADAPEEQAGLAARLNHMMDAGAILHEIERMISKATAGIQAAAHEIGPDA